VGAVKVGKGSELIYFDSRKNISLEEGMKTRSKDSIMRNPQEVKHCRIDPKHIMASGAILPSFPVVEIDGEHYCDGGHLSNTPVRMAYETGQLNKNTLVVRADLWSRDTRKPETALEAEALRKALQYSSPPIDLSGKVAGHIHTVLPTGETPSYTMDFDFSRHTIQKNWNAGYHDMQTAIAQYRKQAAGKKNGTIAVGNGGDAMHHQANGGQHR
jgi:predicted acylesterase/phospholipase RssA